MADRCALLARAAEAIRARAKELLPLVIAETGATAAVGSRMQVPQAAVRFAHYAQDPTRVLQTPLLPQAVGATPLAPGGIIGGMVNRQPVGVVACVTSFNFPLVNMAGKVAPALAAGNTVVMKPAPQDPLAIVELARIFDEVGFPPGVVNLVNAAGPEPAAALVDSPDVDMVSFTGSTEVGTRIMEASGKTMKRLLLELGGKGACVVLDDADVRAAIGCISSTWTFHSGQICTAPTRAVVHRSLFDQVRDGLAAMAGMLKVGDPTEKDTVVGPVISAVQRGAHRGATWPPPPTRAARSWSAASGPPLERGYYVAPTLIVGDNNMTVAREEIFGPVITMIPFDDEEEGVAIANDSDYGLYDYVFSGDGARAFSVARRLQAGHVGVNTAQRNHDAPFGGLQDERGRARRRRLRPPGLQRAAVHHLDHLSRRRPPGYSPAQWPSPNASPRSPPGSATGAAGATTTSWARSTSSTTTPGGGRRPACSSGQALPLGLPLSEAEGIQMGFVPGRDNPTPHHDRRQPAAQRRPRLDPRQRGRALPGPAVRHPLGRPGPRQLRRPHVQRLPGRRRDGRGRGPPCGIHLVRTLVSRGVLLDVARAKGSTSSSPAIRSPPRTSTPRPSWPGWTSPPATWCSCAPGRWSTWRLPGRRPAGRRGPPARPVGLHLAHPRPDHGHGRVVPGPRRGRRGHRHPPPRGRSRARTRGSTSPSTCSTWWRWG